MPYNQPTQCPKCHYMSEDPETCESCGALISVINQRNREAALLADQQRAASQRIQEYDTGSSLTRKMIFALVFLVGAGALWYVTMGKSSTASDGFAYSVTTSTFDNEVIDHTTSPVLVDFYATWCGPCKQMAPDLEEFASSNTGRIKVVKVDIDNNPDLAARYSVQAVPTLILINNGKEVRRALGAQNAQRLESTFASYM